MAGTLVRIEHEVSEIAKVTKNLSLDEAAVQRGERYSALHDTTLSRLVSDFLIQLPVDEPIGPLPPLVRRLVGIGTSETPLDNERREPEMYRDYLKSKYGDS